MAVAAVLWLAGFAPAGTIAAVDPIVYTITFPEPDTHVAYVEARIPTNGRQTIDLMMANWSPGFYRLEDYAANVQALLAKTTDGDIIGTAKRPPNRWHIQTGGRPLVVVTYRLMCTGRSVTANFVGTDLLVLNGPATFVTMIEPTSRPAEVHLELPPTWKQSMTSLDAAPDGKPNHYVAPDFDTLADSPIVAGDLKIHTFDAGGARHSLVDVGDIGEWDGAVAARQMKAFVDQDVKLWGSLPFKRYLFLNVFRPGGGGLEHANSTLLTASPGTKTPTGRWLKYVSHEYFHAFNVKRLRPIELGPFDYENPPSTPSLWISEGLTTYYGDLAVDRSVLGNAEDFLSGLSSQIRQLQTSPGRLVQTLEDASRDVWTSSTSGIGGDTSRTVSYYVKGMVVGFLLDAHIRHVTAGRKSLDDVMRLAYQRYSGARGFRPAEFQTVASEVANDDLADWFHQSIATTDELDYTEALDWYGLRFVEPGSADPERAWTLDLRPDATPAQKQHLTALVGR
jgi:predicted metalloprotease with PDZ domain